MRAYVVNTFRNPLERVEQSDPVAKGTEVVIDVARCGICHSDLHIQDGYYDLGGGKRLDLADRGVSLPVTMGHEILGRLISKGADAPIQDSEIGKTFLIYPWLGCGQCDTCLRGEENLCSKPSSLGVFRAGGYAERCLVPHPKYLIDITGMDPTLAATYACSGLTAYSAIRKVEVDREKDVLLILGAGGVGLSGLHIALGLGFRKVAVADIDPAKRELAMAHGAKFAFDTRDIESSMKKLNEGGGVAAAVDFVGAKATAEFAIGALRKAGTYIVVGLFGGDVTLSLPPIVLRAITIRGSYVGNLAELKELVSLARSGKIKPLPVEAVSFDDINSALGRLRAGKVHGRLVLAR